MANSLCTFFPRMLFTLVCLGGTEIFLPVALGQSQASGKKVVNPAIPAGQSEESDKDRLQGTWEIQSLDLGSKVVKRGDMRMEWKEALEKPMFFQGDRHGQVGHSSSRFKLDETREPKQITVYSDNGKQVFRGIYSLEGDILKLCMNGDGTSVCRPEEFVTKKGTPIVITTLKKVAAKK